MFLFQFHSDSMRLREEERRRDERNAQLLVALRELRGAVPPFDGGVTRRLAAAMAEPRYAGPERRLVPCPEMKEATTP